MGTVPRRFGDFSHADLHAMVSGALGELLQRAVEDEDADVLVERAMQEMFSGSGDPKPPTMFTRNIIALAGTVQDTSAEKHACALWTVKLPSDEPPSWAWNDSIGTFVHSDSEKVGKLRRSVQLHVAVNDMVIAQHRMVHDGTRHQRIATKAWTVVTVEDATDDGFHMELQPAENYTPTHLPPPQGEQDTRSARYRNGA